MQFLHSRRVCMVRESEGPWSLKACGRSGIETSNEPLMFSLCAWQGVAGRGCMSGTKSADKSAFLSLAVQEQRIGPLRLAANSYLKLLVTSKKVITCWVLSRARAAADPKICDSLTLQLDEVNGKPTPSPEAFVKAIEHIPDKQYFPVQWYELQSFRSPAFTQASVLQRLLVDSTPRSTEFLHVRNWGFWLRPGSRGPSHLGCLESGFQLAGSSCSDIKPVLLS